MKKEKGMSKTESFVGNSGWNIVAILFAKFGGMLFSIILARFLLPEKFGLYTLALAITLFLLSLTNLAMNQTMSRYMSDSLKSKNKLLARAYFQFVSHIKVIFSFITTTLLIILAYPLSIYVFNKPDLLFPLIFFSIYAVFLSIQNLYETIFYVIGKVKLLTIKELILQSFKFITCFALFFLLSPSLPAAIFAITFSSLIALLFLKFFLNKHMPFLFKKTNKTFDKVRVKKFIKNSILSSTFNTISDNVDIILLGIFVTSDYVGYYSAAFLIVGGFFGLMSLSNLSLPLFTQINKGETKKVFESLLKYLSIISIPLIFGIGILGKYLLRFLYGYDYLESTIPLIFLSLLIFESPITENLKSFLLSKEKPEVIARIVFISTAINISLSLILLFLLSNMSMLLSLLGITVSLIISRFIVLIYLSQYIKKNFGMSYNSKFLIKPLFASLVMIIPLILINSYISDLNFFIVMLEVIGGALIYSLVMLLIKGLKKDDFSVVKRIFIRDTLFHIPLFKKFFVANPEN
jgi:O-antigen/teichoic acid export membrane protein